MFCKRITNNTKNINHIIFLYESSFPQNERRDIQELIDENSEGMEFLAFYEKSTNWFCKHSFI